MGISSSASKAEPTDMKDPITVCVTGGGGQIAYSLLPSLCSGSVFGDDQPVILSLLDIPPAMTMLSGVKMELEDLAFPLYAGAVCTDDPMVAFKDAVRAPPSDTVGEKRATLILSAHPPDLPAHCRTM